MADPSTESQVAQDLIAAIDTQSKGTYQIASTTGNVSLIDAWMTNEGGLWADNHPAWPLAILLPTVAALLAIPTAGAIQVLAKELWLLTAPQREPPPDPSG